MLNQRIGNYRVIRLLGEGGMGVVYEAVRDDIGARAAVKVLRPEYARNTDMATRFFNEARAANMIQHAGIVRVFDYGHLPTGEAYLAMELLEGESLRGRLERETRLSETDTIRLGRQIASVLVSAHQKQIIHRDLKPENIMLIPDAETPGGERAKLLDFGIAKLESDSAGAFRTKTNTVMGTPVYMAPEQCRGIKAIGDRVDVYALAVMMFEMLAGRPPFLGEAPGDIIAMHMFQPPPMLSSFISDCDPSLNRLIAMMLSKDPQSRPSMTEVAQTLKALGNLVSDVMPMRLVSDPEFSVSAARAAETALRQQAPEPAQNNPFVSSAAASVPPLTGKSEFEATDPDQGPPRSQQPQDRQGPLARTIATSAPPGPMSRPGGLTPLLEPPTLPVPAFSLRGKKASQAQSAAQRLESIPGSAPEDKTELMTAKKLPIAAIQAASEEAPDYDATVPIMRLRQVQAEEVAYLRQRGINSPDWLQQSRKKLRTVTDSVRGQALSRWQNPEHRKIILALGGLLLIGIFLVLLIVLIT